MRIELVDKRQPTRCPPKRVRLAARRYSLQRQLSAYSPRGLQLAERMQSSLSYRNQSLAPRNWTNWDCWWLLAWISIRSRFGTIGRLRDWILLSSSSEQWSMPIWHRLHNRDKEKNNRYRKGLLLNVSTCRKSKSTLVTRRRLFSARSAARLTFSF